MICHGKKRNILSSRDCTLSSLHAGEIIWFVISPTSFHMLCVISGLDTHYDVAKAHFQLRNLIRDSNFLAHVHRRGEKSLAVAWCRCPPTPLYNSWRASTDRKKDRNCGFLCRPSQSVPKHFTPPRVCLPTATEACLSFEMNAQCQGWIHVECS